MSIGIATGVSVPVFICLLCAYDFVFVSKLMIANLFNMRTFPPVQLKFIQIRVFDGNKNSNYKFR